YTLHARSSWPSTGRFDAIFFFSSRRRHTRWPRDWSSDVCSSDLWITPADHPRCPIPEREGEVCDGYGHLAEQRRPELADAERGGAVREVGVREANPHLGLLVAERRRPIECAEEVGLQRRARRPLPHHRGPAEGEVDARIAHIAVQVGLVRGRLHRVRKLGVLAVAESKESIVHEPRGVDESA